MNRVLGISNRKQIITCSFVRIGRCVAVIGAVTLALTVPAISQDSGLQEKLAAVKQAAAENAHC